MSPKTLPIESAMRAKIAAHLSGAFDTAIASYRSFYDQKEFEDAKAFSAHHAACKAAIAHLQLLIKLAAWVEGDASDDDAERLNEQMMAAAAELKNAAWTDIDV